MGCKVAAKTGQGRPRLVWESPQSYGGTAWGQVNDPRGAAVGLGSLQLELGGSR